jgi:RNA polymerase sigma factor (sigma-70 family)
MAAGGITVCDCGGAALRWHPVEGGAAMDELDSIDDKELASQNSLITASPASGDANVSVREDVIQRALAMLAAERERTGVSPSLSSIERVCDRLRLSPAEILQTKGQIESDEADEPDGSEDEGSDVLELEGFERGNVLVDRMLGHSLLTASEERELGRAVRLGRVFGESIADGSIPTDSRSSEVIRRGLQAQHGLVLSNIRLAMDIAKRYENRGLEREDLLQEGIIGLMRAVESFDPDLGFRFSTYATWWIRQSVTRAVLNVGRIVRIPVHVAEKLNRLRRAERRLKARAPGSAIDVKQLADELGWTSEQVGRLMVIDAERFLSAESEDEEGTSLLDKLRSPTPDPERCTMDIDLQHFIDRCLKALDPRAAEIVRLRFGLSGGSSQTLETVGQHFGLTRERIRQIESKTLGKLAVRHHDDLKMFVQEAS